MNIEMHQKSSEKLYGLIQGLLKETRFSLGSTKFDYDSKSFEYISLELNKRKTEFKTNSISCMLVYMESIRVFIKRKRMDEQGLDLIFNDLDAGEFDDAVGFILSIYKSIPMHYKIKIPLNNVNFNMDSGENYRVNIVGGRIRRLALQESYDDYSILSTIHLGCFSIYEENFFMKDVLLKLNIILFFLKVFKITEHTKVSAAHNGWGLFGPFEKHDIPVIRVSVENINYPEIYSDSILSISLSKYLSEISLTEDYKNKGEPKDIEQVLFVSDLLVKDDTREGVKIKAAIDWFMQSEVTDDLTMSFLQICMGLESIFGDDDYEYGLTNVLADRCSYLIGKSIAERKEIKVQFKEIYKLRSKIVHGVKGYLSSQEMDIKRKATMYLSKSILKEISNIGFL